MGIKGLLNLLAVKSDFHEFFYQKIPKGSVLLIDGNNFMFHLMSLPVPNHSPQLPGTKSIDRRYGGSYLDFQAILHRELKFLTETLGFQLEFYFDGSHSPFKDLIIEERKSSLEGSWTNFYKTITYHRMLINQGNLPLPPMTRLIFEFLIKRDFPNIPVFNCLSEADIDLAKRCVELNTEYQELHLYDEMIKRAYVYSDDSDFFVMKNCLFIKFRTFSENFCESDYIHYYEKENYFIGEVFERSLVARYLGFPIDNNENQEEEENLQEQKFVDFCILLGSDFTKPFGRFKFILNDSNENKILTAQFPDIFKSSAGDINTVCKIFDFVKQRVPNFRLASTDPEIQLCIDYSREFYELTLDDDEYVDKHAQLADQEDEKLDEEDLKALQEEDDNESGEINVDSKKEEINKEIDAYIDTEIGSNKKKKNIIPLIPKPIKKDFENTLKSQAYTFQEAVQKVVEFIQSDTFQGDMSIEEVAEEPWFNFDRFHVKAFQNISRVIDNVHYTIDFREEPLWEDVKAAKLLQELLVLAFKHSSDFAEFRSSNSANLQSFPPHLFFDGKVFHKILFELRHNQFHPEKKKAEAATPEEEEDVGVESKEPEEEEESEVEEESEEEEDEDDEDSSSDDDDSVLAELRKHDSEKEEEKPEHSEPLPVLKYEQRILETLRKDRFLIVRGETGCGKSTGIPVMILNEAKRLNKRCKILVCEPHRSAAMNLFLRVQDTIEDPVGLRLGMSDPLGSPDPTILFATAGYVFSRYVGNLEELDFTHIIIDEIHERSVENDLVCLIVNQLFRQNQSLSVILMSATVESEIFYRYFHDKKLTVGNNLDAEPDAEAPIPNLERQQSFKKPEYIRQLSTETFEKDDFSLWVGKKRYDTEIFYIEDIYEDNEDIKHLKPIFNYDFFILAKTINDICESGYISNSLFRKQCDLAVALLSSCPLGSSVLIFVPGMSEINLIHQALAKKSRYCLFGIHSELDKDEEAKAFEQFPAEEKMKHVRVVVATNAAESSITLPDLNIVIDFGTNNVEEYDSSDFSRTTIETKWISQPSAIQRAGRTGRVGPGVVYRLYTLENYTNDFPEENTPDIKKKPLYDAIIRVLGNLKGTFHRNTVQEVFLDLMEPPKLSRLEDSIRYLHKHSLIQGPSIEECKLTALGEFASLLPMGAHLARLLFYSTMLGYAEYGIILSGILSQTVFPFRNPKPEYYEPDDYNDLVRDLFLGQVDLDFNDFSETLMLCKLYIKWKNATNAARGWMNKEYNLDGKKMAKLDQQIKVIKRRFQLILVDCNLEDQVNKIKDAFDGLNVRDFGDKTLATILRILLVWISDGNILKLSHENPDFTMKNAQELITMTARDINFDKGTVLFYDHVVRAVKCNELFPPTKSKRGRGSTKQNPITIEETLVPRNVISIKRQIYNFKFSNIQRKSKGNQQIARTGVNVFQLAEKLMFNQYSDVPLVWSWVQLPQRIPLLKRRKPIEIKAKSRPAPKPKPKGKNAFQFDEDESSEDENEKVEGEEEKEFLEDDENQEVLGQICSLLIFSVKTKDDPKRVRIDDLRNYIIPQIFSGGAKEASLEELNFSDSFTLTNEMINGEEVQHLIFLNPSFGTTIFLRQILLLVQNCVELYVAPAPASITPSSFLEVNLPDSLLAIKGFNVANERKLGEDIKKLFSSDFVQDYSTYQIKEFLALEFADAKRNLNRNGYFEDIPIGLRLLNAYCRKKFGNYFSVGSLIAKADMLPAQRKHEYKEVFGDKGTNVRGVYAKWGLLNSALNLSSEGNTHEKAIGDEIEEQVTKGKDEFHKLKWDDAQIGPDCFLKNSFPKLVLRRNEIRDPEKTVYGIANNVIVSKRGRGVVYVTCNQVTLLPYPKNWLIMVMALTHQGDGDGNHSANHRTWLELLPERTPDEIETKAQIREFYGLFYQKIRSSNSITELFSFPSTSRWSSTIYLELKNLLLTLHAKLVKDNDIIFATQQREDFAETLRRRHQKATTTEATDAADDVDPAKRTLQRAPSLNQKIADEFQLVQRRNADRREGKYVPPAFRRKQEQEAKKKKETGGRGGGVQQGRGGGRGGGSANGRGNKGSKKY